MGGSGASRHADVLPQTATSHAPGERSSTTTRTESASSTSAVASSTEAVLAMTSTTTTEPLTTATETTTAAGVPTSSTGSAGAAAESKCYNFYSKLNVNPLQEYPNNPDSKALGFATCKLCTGGAMHCTSLLQAAPGEFL